MAGAALAGRRSSSREARVWQRRHGGNLVTLHPYVVSAGWRSTSGWSRFRPTSTAPARWPRRSARWPGIEVVPDPPQTPMFHLLLRGDRERLADAALALAEERGVFLFGDPSTTTSPSVQLVER